MGTGGDELTCVIATGQWWTDQYMVKPIGILEAPTVLAAKEALAEIPEERAKMDEDWVVVSP